MVGLFAAPAVGPLMQRCLPPYIVEAHDACANDDGERASLLLAVYNGMEGVGSRGGAGECGRRRRRGQTWRPCPKSLHCSGSLSPPWRLSMWLGQAAAPRQPPTLPLAPPSPPSLSHLPLPSWLPPRPSLLTNSLPSLFSHLTSGITSRFLPALAGFDLGLSLPQILWPREGGEEI